MILVEKSPSTTYPWEILRKKPLHPILKEHGFPMLVCPKVWIPPFILKNSENDDQLMDLEVPYVHAHKKNVFSWAVKKMTHPHS